jgi:hypothetical protein
MAAGIKHTIINGETHDVELFASQLPGVPCPDVQTVVACEEKLFPICRHAMNMFKLVQGDPIVTARCASR